MAVQGAAKIEEWDCNIVRYYLAAVRDTFGSALVNGNCQRKLCPDQSVVEFICFLKLQNQDGNHAKCT